MKREFVASDERAFQVGQGRAPLVRRRLPGAILRIAQRQGFGEGFVFLLVTTPAFGFSRAWSSQRDLMKSRSVMSSWAGGGHGTSTYWRQP